MVDHGREMISDQLVTALSSKILYGLHELSLQAIEVFVRLYLFVHFAEIVRLPPWLVGIALLLSLATDAVIEPWIGRLCDSWFESGRSRWPWVLTGSLIAGTSLIAMFAIPADLATAQAFSALLVTSLTLNTGLALAGVPYSAMVGDLKYDDPKAQSHLVGFRAAFGGLGSFVGIALPGYFLTHKDPAPFLQSSWGLTIILFLLVVLSSLSRPAFLPEERAEKIPDNWSPTLNLLLPFRRFPRPPSAVIIALVAGFFLNVGLAISSSVALPYYKYALQFDETETQWLLLAFFACWIFLIPFWIWCGHRFGLLKALVTGGFLLGSTTTVMTFGFTPGQFLPVLLIASAWCGFCVGSSVLLERMLTAMGDRHQEGAGLGYIFGLWKMSAKLARAFGMAFAGVALSWAGIQGFDPRIGDRLNIVFGPVVGVLILLACVVLWTSRQTVNAGLVHPKSPTES